MTNPLDQPVEDAEEAIVEGKSTQAELQAWIDEHITPKAIETAVKLHADRMIYGFSMLDRRTGERIDPTRPLSSAGSVLDYTAPARLLPQLIQR